MAWILGSPCPTSPSCSTGSDQGLSPFCGQLAARPRPPLSLSPPANPLERLSKEKEFFCFDIKFRLLVICLFSGTLVFSVTWVAPGVHMMKCNSVLACGLAEAHGEGITPHTWDWRPWVPPHTRDVELAWPA